MTDDTLLFEINNIDINTVYTLYQESLGSELRERLKRMTDDERKEYNFIKLPSAIVINHPQIEEFNNLYRQLLDVELTGDAIAIDIAKENYKDRRLALSIKIISDIRNDFADAIKVNDTIKAKLQEHIDTLFFICLLFYNLYWDPFGETYNGSIASLPISELTFEGQPYYYRSSQQLEFISKLLYSHYNKPNAQKKEIILTVGGDIHATSDPNIVDWLLNLISGDNLPISLDYNGTILSNLLKNRDQMEHSDFLTQLKKFTNLGSPNYADVKRKVVKKYCLAIHKIFSYYMQLPEKAFTGKRLNIYHNILLAFKMDNFSTPKRMRDAENVRKVTPQDRLGYLLRSQS